MIKPINLNDLAKSQLTAQLLLYCHLIEMETLYDLSFNLANIAKGRDFQEKPFSNSAVYPWKKIDLIEKSDRDLGRILRGVYCREVRNAFAHSKYKIEAGYFIKTDQDFSIAIEELQAKVNLLNGYWGFLYYMIGKEQMMAMKMGEIRTENGDILRIGIE